MNKNPFCFVLLWEGVEQERNIHYDCLVFSWVNVQTCHAMIKKEYGKGYSVLFLSHDSLCNCKFGCISMLLHLMLKGVHERPKGSLANWALIFQIRGYLRPLALRDALMLFLYQIRKRGGLFYHIQMPILQNAANFNKEVKIRKKLLITWETWLQ